jgi:hypothetical protein
VKLGLCLWFFQWLDIPGGLRQALSSSLIQAWRQGELGQLLRDSPEDLEKQKAGLQKLQEPYKITPGSEKYMPYILELDTLRYLPVAHILHARDLKGPEYVASIQAQLLQVERYLLDQGGAPLRGWSLSPFLPPGLERERGIKGCGNRGSLPPRECF